MIIDVNQSLAGAYWAEAAERQTLRNGTREQRIEYQSRVFPVEDALASRIDANEPTLLADLVAIAEAAPDAEMLSLFGAGIVWEFLYNTPDKNFAAIADAAVTNSAFMEALRAAFAGWDGLGPNARHHLKPLLD